MLEGEPLSLGEISQRLGVSRASVSTNARQLARRGALRLTARAGDRQDFYELNNFPSIDMVNELAERILRHARAIDAFGEPMQRENAAASARINDLGKAFGHAATLLERWASAMNDDQTLRKDQP